MEKGYPIKIFEDLYIINYANARDNEEIEILKLDLLNKIEFLMHRDPLCKKATVRHSLEEFYTPSFGNFIVAEEEKKFIRFEDEDSAKEKAKTMFLKLKEYYEDINSGYHELEEATHTRKKK